MTRLTWLHLSDWHQRGSDFDRQVVRDALIRDIRQRAQIAPSLAEVDFIVFSGDLAFSGESAEYEAARKHLLDPLLEATALKADKIFCVPGNHDLNRNTVFEMLPLELQKPLDSEIQVQKWLTDEIRRARVLEPFEAYREFITGYTGQSTPDYASIRRWNFRGKEIALLGLNSAWVCGRRQDLDDYWRVVIGEPQIRQSISELDGADLRIVVLHYPVDWLASFDRNRIEPYLARQCHFILHGPQHNLQISSTPSTLGDCVTIPAGASYNRHIAKNRFSPNTYNYVHLDFDAGQGTIYLRTWSEQQSEWRKDTDSYSDGKFLLNSLPKNLGADKVSRPTSRDTSSSMSHQVVEQRYRELLLETCDIINLANLPEQDRHIAQKQQELKLRGLYIPLRVHVESSVSEETIESSQEIHSWKELEELQSAARRSESPKERKVYDKYQRVPVGERLAEAKRLVVLGDPGAGKTTLTRWIATAYLLHLKHDEDWKEIPDVKSLPEADWLPIIIRCRDLDLNSLTGSLDDILKYILRRTEFTEVEITNLSEILKRRLKEGRALLMLDGLDEITDPTARASFCQQLEQIVAAYPEAPIIATSRIVGYREMGYKLGRDFEHLILADLISEEKDDFARRWCTITEVPERREAAAMEFIHDIHSAERIERLTGNPMLLTTMALVKRKIGKLPNRRAELYREAAQVLLNWRREVDAPLDVREAIPQLEYLAYAMCDRGVQQLRQDEIIGLFARMREEYPNVHAVRNSSPEEFLKRLEARTGILVEIGHTQLLGTLIPVYEFRHLTFQEYLAACALVDGRFPGRDSKQSLAAHVAPLAGRTTEMAFTELGPKESAVVENWREALRLCVSICNDDDVDGILLAILNPLEGETPTTGRARAILAALCLADEPNASTQVAEKVLQTLTAKIGVEDGTGSSRTGIDAAAIELAGTRWASALRSALLSEFYWRKPETRESPGGVFATVSTAGIPQNEAELTDWLTTQTQRLSNENELVAIDAALSIMNLAYQTKTDPSHSQAYLIPGLVDALINCLSGSAPMACAAAWTLGWLNNNLLSKTKEGSWRPTPNEIQSLISFVSDPRSDAQAVRFLTWILRQERVEQATEPLIPWLDNPIAEVRKETAEALGNIGSEAAITALIVHLEDSNPEVRSTIARTLAEIGNKAAIEPLISRLDDPNEELRRTIVGILAQSLEESDLKLLSHHLNGRAPFLDPHESINKEFIQKVASKLKLTIEEVKARYEALAERFHLNLEWKSAK